MPKDGCPFGGYEKTYKDYTADELYGLLMRDEPLYRDGGGVTFSGGEPLLQAFAIKPLLQRLKKENVHIAFETTLYAPREQYQAVKEYVDYWLVDLKFQFGYIANRDYDIGIHHFEENLLDLQSLGRDILYRMVGMEEMMSLKNKIVNDLLMHEITKLEILDYHGLAENKYKQLDKSFKPFKKLTDADIKEIDYLFSISGIITEYKRL
jgi:pyruvate formate lyase activating enzyme